MLNTFTDSEIISLILKGETNAFEYLIDKYSNYVFSLVTRHIPYKDVEEVSHSVFIETYKLLKKCNEHNKFKSWLSVITIRRCYDYWRKKYRSQEINESSLSIDQKNWIDNVITSKSINECKDKGLKEEAIEILNIALNSLSAKERMIITLIYYEGYSMYETAKILNINIMNVKIHSYRTRKKLKIFFYNFLKKESK